MRDEDRLIHVAIPALNEAEYLPRTLDCLAAQKTKNVHVWVCVNQPDHWWNDKEKISLCQNNQQSLSLLLSMGHPNLHVIDRSSPGKGWDSKSHGVGMARKVLMDAINRSANGNDIMVSLDADTLFGPHYLDSVREVFKAHPLAIALSNPYYHKLSGDPVLDRAMLRYEIYMRHYAINMWRISSPYCFTALGSAISLPVRSYRRIGGITAKKSGEDFYFLQKLRKTGWICNYNNEKVYPGTRYSDRVFFGTGPALIKGSLGNWDSYPVYDYRLFDRVSTLYKLFPAFYEKPVNTPLTPFLIRQFRAEDPFRALRENSASVGQFIAACHQKIDGLRILQYLKSETGKNTRNDEASLIDFLYAHYPEVFVHEKSEKAPYGFSDKETAALKQLDFKTTDITLLNKIRNLLVILEEEYQKNDLK